MHSSTLANDFSSRSTLVSAPFQPLLSRCARCLPSKSRVLTLLRTLFLSLRSFRRSPRLFSAACGLFLQNTRGGGGSATSQRSLRLPILQLRLSVITSLFLPSLYFHPLTNPLSTRIDSQHSLFSRTYKSLFPQLLCIHIYTKRPGVTPPHNFSADPTRIGIPTEHSDEGRFPHVVPRLLLAKPRGIRHFPQPVLSCSPARGIC